MTATVKAVPWNSADLSPLVAGLFPAGVVAAELRGEASPAGLYDEELIDCRTFGERRIADFAAGRLCARRALAGLGVAHFPLRCASDRRPRWPGSVVGSISHTVGLCGAVVAREETLRSVGLDIELLGRANEEVWILIFTRSETAKLHSLSPAQRSLAATIAFSAKEAYYKCQFGITGAWLDFTDVEVTFGEDLSHEGVFHVLPRRNADRLTDMPVTGRYALEGPFVLTGISVTV